RSEPPPAGRPSAGRAALRRRSAPPETRRAALRRDAAATAARPQGGGRLRSAALFVSARGAALRCTAPRAEVLAVRDHRGAAAVARGDPDYGAAGSGGSVWGWGFEGGD